MTIFLVLSACGDSDSPIQAQPIEPINEQPSAGQCSQSPYEGNEIAASPSFMGLTNTGFFDKTLAAGHLERLYNSSGQASWNYILSLGVPIYKIIQQEAAQCKYFAAIPEASGKFQKSWQEFATSGRPLLGLFTSTLSKNTSNGSVSLKEATIMVREDSERWTLLHEFSHYLFASSRTSVNNLLFDSEIENELVEIQNKIQRVTKKWKQEQNNKRGLRLSKLWSQFVNKTLELDRRGPLEEFAVEGYLLELYQNGFLKNIDSNYSVQNAKQYMQLSAFQALTHGTDSLYTYYKKIMRKLNRLQFSFNKLTDKSAKKKNRRTIKKIQELLDFLDASMNWSSNIVEDQNPDLQMLDSLSPHKPHSLQMHWSEGRRIFQQEILEDIL